MAVPVSLTPERFLSLPHGELSLRHYATLVSSEEWRASLRDSLVIALSAMVLAVGLGTVCAVGLWRVASRLSELVRGLILMPIIVPPIVSALAFYRLWIDLKWLDTYLE